MGHRVAVLHRHASRPWSAKTFGTLVHLVFGTALARCFLRVSMLLGSLIFMAVYASLTRYA